MNPKVLQTIFDGVFYTSYSQFYINVDGTYDVTEETDKDQHNGLLLAGFPTLLHFIVGRHTGGVRLRLELLDGQPADAVCWEEVTEASFSVPVGKDLWLTPCLGTESIRFTLPPADYRVRYSARQFGLTDEAREDSLNCPTLDERYLISFWVAERHVDTVLKATSPKAKYHHDAALGRASKLPPLGGA